MSEYQYYEYQTVGHRLTEPEMTEIRKLSSRVQLSPSRAIFLYHYGDFHGEPETVLAKYFDALLYITNWGTRQLAFRFPKELVNLEAIRKYCASDNITAEVEGNYVILNIEINKEDGEWIRTGEGLLDEMIPLRQAIMENDYRSLYLAWLRACELDFGEEVPEVDDEEVNEEDNPYAGEYYFEPDTLEPPVPPSLKNLDSALEAFIDFFEIDPAWVALAANSSPTESIAEDRFEHWIAALPEADCRRLLLRAVEDRPEGVAIIRKELRDRFGGISQDSTPAKPRTVAQLAALVPESRKRLEEEERRKKEEDRLKRLKEVEKRETAIWEEVREGVRRQTGIGYDKAVTLLVDLRDLAVRRGDLATYQRQLAKIRSQVSPASSFLTRLKNAGL